MSDEPKYRDEEWLREQYIDRKKTTIEIAKKCSINPGGVGYWLRKYGVDTSQRRRDNKYDKLADREWLREQYVEQELTQAEIADECGCSQRNVSRWLNKHGIETRPGTPTKSDSRLADGEWLRGQYVEQELTQAEIADECGCSQSTVRDWFSKHNIETRSVAQQQAADSRLTDPEWLRQQYVRNERKTREIADECGCSQSTVRDWLNKHDIDARSVGQEQAADSRLTDPEWLRQQYVENSRTMSDIAEECGCTAPAVYNWLNKHGIGEKKERHVSGSDHPNYNGGKKPYGPGWNNSKKRAVRERDGYTCQDPNCSITQSEHLEHYGQKLHVHHLRKARDVDDPKVRNAKENLITLCRDCHDRWEKVADAALVPEVIR